ncbi:hypothetical protein HanRHA438_Chr02g0085191 [Helianthus annuus]|nr:hypothetical protein HanHA300_Chr02g0061541 [Helianthus annuus]KAJ0619319.1 hypothetical protein HanHA89_Chr02g0070041 [Helianthus annuus]KAJ0940595.1 hypothetical protein HanRHA438_Chr02g0085191 [Helianthus annuus]
MVVCGSEVGRELGGRRKGKLSGVMKVMKCRSWLTKVAERSGK